MFPFVVEDGILSIEARKGSDGKWRSGLLSSNDPDGRGFAQRYGYFEMRAKLPTGPGVWPAFWLIGDRDPSTRVEIDVLEYYGIKPDRFFSTVHVWRKPEMADTQTFQMEHGVPAAHSAVTFTLTASLSNPTGWSSITIAWRLGDENAERAQRASVCACQPCARVGLSDR